MMLLTSLNYALSLGLRRDVPARRDSSPPRCCTRSAISPASRSSRSPRARRSRAGTSSFSLALSGGAIDRARGRRSRARRCADDRRHRGGVDADGHARSACARRAAAFRSAASRCRRDYPLGLWRGWAYVHFPLAGHRVSGARSARRRRCRRGAQGVDPHARRPRRRRRSRGTARVPARRSAAARRVEGGRARRRMVHEVVRRRRRRRPVALDWYALPTHLDAEDAAVAADRVGARRRADDAAVRADAARHSHLPTGRDASTGARALTALALMPPDAR